MHAKLPNEANWRTVSVREDRGHAGYGVARSRLLPGWRTGSAELRNEAKSLRAAKIPERSQFAATGEIAKRTQFVPRKRIVTDNQFAKNLASARRLIVKIGSALLVDEATGDLRTLWLDALCADLAECRGRGQEVLIVTSGAVAVGRRHLGLIGRTLRLEEKQAAAAAGQIRLAHAWLEALGRHGIGVAQILLTPDDTEARRRHLNARATLEQLLVLGAVPVINENDTVATAELRFGDNDRLAARVAQMISADTLVLLSDIDGLYSADPRHDPAARHIAEVRELTPEIEAMAGRAPPGASSGGMVTKLQAARIAMAAGCRSRRSRPARARLGSSRRPSRAPRESAGSPARSTRWARSRSTTAQRRPWHAARAFSPPASSPSKASSNAATRCW
jgi:glutamate 5-kinase